MAKTRLGTVSSLVTGRSIAGFCAAYYRNVEGLRAEFARRRDWFCE